MISIADYKNEYKKEIDNPQKSQWGEGSDTDNIFSSIEKYHAKVALFNGTIIGASVCHIEDKICHIDFIIIKPLFQKKE